MASMENPIQTASQTSEETGSIHLQEQQPGGDRISTLPDHMAHHILSLLPTKSAARMSVLSKRWENLWLTFPVVEFSERWFTKSLYQSSRALFLAAAETSLSRRDLTHMKKFRINVRLPRDPRLDDFVGRYLPIAMAGRVQELDLRFAIRVHAVDEDSCDRCYLLPEVIFSSGSSLSVLKLEGCRIEDFDIGDFSSLTTLSLRHIHISNEMLQNIIRCCSSVENMTFECIYGLKTFRVFSHKLKSLVLICRQDLDEIEMDVPKLEQFEISGPNSDAFGRISQNHTQSIEISNFKVANEDSFSSLITLSLSYAKINVEAFKTMMSSFQNLEGMILRSCVVEARVRAFLKRLESLAVDECNFPKQVEINAPHLKTLHCKGIRKSCIITHSGEGFNSLKNLSLIGDIGWTNEEFQELISSCHSLELLYLKSCYRLEYLRIACEKLRTLYLDGCLNLENYEIGAPNLEFFKYIGPIVEFSHVIPSAGLAVELNIMDDSVSSMSADALRGRKLWHLLQRFDQTKSIKMISYRAEFLTIPEEVSTFPPIYLLRHLEVHTCLDQMGRIDLLLGLLRYAFCRETMLIELETSSIYLKFLYNDEEPVDVVDFLGTDHDCIRDHLIEVRLDNIAGDKDEIKLVAFLLGKAQLLKTMELSLAKPCCPGPSHRHPPEIFDKIKFFPKASANVEIALT